MAEKITALKIQKRRSNRINIFLGGEYAFSVPAFVAAHLKLGQVLSADDIRTLQEAAALEDGYERALNQLSRRPRSQQEIERYLDRKGYDPTVIDRVVDRLLAKGYLDDQAFAEIWVENRFEFRPRGARALRAELMAKGLKSSVIEDALEDYDERQAALRAGRKAARRWQRSEEDEFTNRLSGYLARRGFGYELVREVVSRMWDENAAASNESEGSE